MLKSSFSKIYLFLLLVSMPMINLAQTGGSCWFYGEIIDSSACDKNVWLYYDVPIDTVYGTSYTIYWGDGNYSSFNITNPGQYQNFLTHTYSQSGVFYPYIVFTSPCVDTFPIRTYGMGGLMNAVVIKDSCIAVSGMAYIDNNNDCQFNLGEQIPNAWVKAYQNGILVDIAYTNSYGYYNLFVGTGPYNLEFDPNLTTSLTSSCGSSANPINLTGNNYDFVFTCNNQFDLSVVINNANYNPVFQTPICFTVQNKSCASAPNAILTIFLNSRLNYLYQSNNFNLVPTINGNTVVFSGINLLPFEYFHGCIYVVGDSTLTLGDTLCVNAVLYAPGDVNLNNNSQMDCSPVTTSYDPNMKEVSINGVPAEGDILPNQTMTYTLHFQNTGNAPALNVVIRDTLPNVLDYSTFQLVDASHFVKVYQNQEKFVFEFPNIMLPDSASDPTGSQGYVTFKVAQKPNLAPGTLIPNNCSIYFDYNPPVVTNTVVSKIATPASKSKISNGFTAVYPNPAQDKLYIRTSYSHYQVTLQDIQGRMLGTFDNAKEISLKEFHAGVYILKVQSANETEFFKIVKEQ